MRLWIEKELFQWEKGRFVFVESAPDESQISYVQFYNKHNSSGPEVPLEGGKAKIPDELLEEYLPIMVVACTGKSGETQVIGRKKFKVIRRARPEEYIPESDDSDDSDNSSDPETPEYPDFDEDVIYDGGEEI